MPALLGLLGAIAVAYFWIARARNAAEMTHELVGVASDVMAAARRLGFRKRHDLHPVESVDDPKLALSALSLAFLELSGLPTAEQHSALQRSLQSHTGQSLSETEESLILGRWLVNESNGPEPAIARLSRRLAKLDRAASFEPLMAVLKDVALAGTGETSPRQKDALAEIARHFRIS
ncbi:MAG: hypothetical protein WBN04_15940 [Paracoccaceae bacterium]